MKKLLLIVCILLSFTCNSFAISETDTANKKLMDAIMEFQKWDSTVTKLREDIRLKDRQIKELKGKTESEEQIKNEQELEKQRQKEYEEAMIMVSKGKDKPEDLSFWVFSNDKNRFRCAVLFASGDSFLIKNNRSDARKAYEQVVRDFPNSRYAVIASRRLEIAKSAKLDINVTYPPLIAEENSVEVADTTLTMIGFDLKKYYEIPNMHGRIAGLEKETAALLQKIESFKKEVPFLEKELQKRNEEFEALKKEADKLAKQKVSESGGEIRLKNGTVIRGKVLRSEGDLLIILREDGSEWPMKRIGIESIYGVPVENLEGFKNLGGE